MTNKIYELANGQRPVGKWKKKLKKKRPAKANTDADSEPTRIIMEFAKKANFGVNASLNGLKNALKRFKKIISFQPRRV